ncbi:hypothetical protein CC2G_010935 [Coprinopsis cinerea AmutBmut pab1-1]|nr:hypothetical protein CC2G_010935 [Coprinopsis cinerea AmutBmut pab1-1]
MHDASVLSTTPNLYYLLRYESTIDMNLFYYSILSDSSFSTYPRYHYWIIIFMMHMYTSDLFFYYHYLFFIYYPVVSRLFGSMLVRCEIVFCWLGRFVLVSHLNKRWGCCRAPKSGIEIRLWHPSVLVYEIRPTSNPLIVALGHWQVLMTENTEFKKLLESSLTLG